MRSREIFSLPDNDWLDKSSREVRELYMGSVARETPHDRNLGQPSDGTQNQPPESEVVDDMEEKK